MIFEKTQLCTTLSYLRVPVDLQGYAKTTFLGWFLLYDDYFTSYFLQPRLQKNTFVAGLRKYGRKDYLTSYFLQYPLRYSAEPHHTFRIPS